MYANEIPGSDTYSMVWPVGCLGFGEGTLATYETELFWAAEELCWAPELGYLLVSHGSR